MSKYFKVAAVVALVAVGACSQHEPGAYEGGGRTNGPIVIGNAGSGCSSAGQQCVSSQDCCSHVCGFNGLALICEPTADSGIPACKLLGNGCTLGVDCCSGFCSSSSLCSAPVQDSGGGD